MVAREARRKLDKVRSLLGEIDKDLGRLYSVFRAVEWHHSGDCEADRVCEEIAKFLRHES